MSTDAAVLFGRRQVPLVLALLATILGFPPFITFFFKVYLLTTLWQCGCYAAVVFGVILLLSTWVGCWWLYGASSQAPVVRGVGGLSGHALGVLVCLLSLVACVGPLVVLL
jgi:hypothetical protein